ncbi:hypothetical protein EG327_007148 [Venturia inaequalis]|uniref:Uncharacterized protein n=1 Tax=Venturia inaequalis TaxID=5025 RepID=A0A8H3Z474_VENIN|nr:hypothetical protein EG327_007148 [Venturia inaequalis]
MLPTNHHPSAPPTPTSNPQDHHRFWTALDKSIDSLALPLTISSTALNITILLNIIYYLLSSISTLLLSLSQLLTTSEHIIGLIAITYCTAVLGLAGVTFLDILGEAMEGDGGGEMALERLLRVDGAVERVNGVVDPVMAAVVEPVLEILCVPDTGPRHAYSNLTC